jgi:hypothetical protein
MEKNTQGSITLIIVFLVFVASVMAGLYFYTQWNKPKTTETEEEKKKRLEAEAEAQKLKEIEEKNAKLKNEIAQEVKNNTYTYLPPAPTIKVMPKPDEEEYIGNVDDNMPQEPQFYLNQVI